MSVVTQNNQIRYTSNGPLDAKTAVESINQLSGFASSEKYVGMTVVVTNAKTTGIPEEYWLVGGIGNNRWIKKAPNFKLILRENGILALELDDGPSDGTPTEVDIRKYIERLMSDTYVDGGSIVNEDDKGNEGTFLKLEYNTYETHEPIYIDVSALLIPPILSDYYTKEESDERFSTPESTQTQIDESIEGKIENVVINGISGTVHDQIAYLNIEIIDGGTY